MEENKNITYTLGQLEDFTLKELKQIDLYIRAEITSATKKKNDVIKLMLDFQSKEIESLKDANAEVKTKEDTEVEVSKEKVEEKKKVKKPIFHRPRRKRNPMTFR